MYTFSNAYIDIDTSFDNVIYECVLYEQKSSNEDR